MSVTQSEHPENQPDTTTRPRVDSSGGTTGAEHQITFDGSNQACEIAKELAKLLHCSPDDFGYGNEEGKPIEILMEETIIECALAVAHLKLGLLLPPRPAEEVSVPPESVQPEEETIILPDRETTVVLRPADYTLEVRRGDVRGAIHIDASQPRSLFSVGIQVDNVATQLDSYTEPRPAFDALMAQLARAADVKDANRSRETAEAEERAVIAKRREEAWYLLERFGSSLKGG